MRPIEALLLLANLLAFVAMTVPLPWMRHAALVAIILAIAQVLVEGSRWQMIPAYALTGLFFLVWLLHDTGAIGAPAAQGQTSRLAVTLVFGLEVLGLALSAALPIILPVFSFPRPSGPYAIGTLTYHWVDTKRPEIFSTDPSARRELMVQLWYPTEADLSSPRAPYIQDADAISLALARVKQLPEFIFGQLKHVTTNAIPSAPVTDDKPNYPLLIFLEGASGYRQMNTFQVEELVSHGYIVAAIDQPYTAASVVFPDGRRANAIPLEQMKPLIHQSYSRGKPAPMLNGKVLEKGIIAYLA